MQGSRLGVTASHCRPIARPAGLPGSVQAMPPRWMGRTMLNDRSPDGLPKCGPRCVPSAPGSRRHAPGDVALLARSISLPAFHIADRGRVRAAAPPGRRPAAARNPAVAARWIRCVMLPRGDDPPALPRRLVIEAGARLFRLGGYGCRRAESPASGHHPEDAERWTPSPAGGGSSADALNGRGLDSLPPGGKRGR
jgi:hypothetical protein